MLQYFEQYRLLCCIVLNVMSVDSLTDAI